MSALLETERFDSLCQQHKIWLICYSSLHWQKPLFLLWYTDNDENSTDRLLIDQTGNILAAESALDLVNTIRKHAVLELPEQVTSWLAAIEGVNLSTQTTYDTISLIDLIKGKKLDIFTLERLANWRNLFGDFVYQDQQNNYLEPYYKDPLLEKAWTYYYDYIFWPSFNEKARSTKRHQPALLIDTTLLSNKLSVMVAAFDARINLVSPTHAVT